MEALPVAASSFDDWGRLSASWSEFVEFMNQELFKLGDTPVSLASLFQLAAVLVLSLVAARLTRTLLRSRILSRTSLDLGQQYSIARLAGYVVALLGFLIGVSMWKVVDLTSLNVLVGALGVGVGFGLQNVVNNFVSGLLILFERPFQLGHRVEVGGIVGRVAQIGARSTTIITNDNIAMIVPNSKFVEESVINWSHGNDRRVRFRLPVGVGYGSDPRQVERLLLEVAGRGKDVLSDPPPVVVFLGFGESSLDFELRVWTDTLFERPKVFMSSLYFDIWEILKKHGIEIPFPQRDVHIKEAVRVAAPS